MTVVPGLAGIRGLLALYVVLHHCWLLAFPGYPRNTGPAWLGWLQHGRLAVVVFIVLSGFSLALAPARDGWRLGGTLSYARRRALRILPAYWAALLLSALLDDTPPTAWSMLVHGLLLQDVLVAPTPNRAFWSIAVEATLYPLLPLLLVIRRRAGGVVMLALVTVPVVVAGLLWPDLATGSRSVGYTLEMAPLFTIGVLAAGVSTRRLPWLGLAAVAAVPVVTLILVNGPEWSVAHYFWLDLAAGPAIALFLAGLANGRPVRLLDTPPLTALGGFSYSLYLIHMPIVALIGVRGGFVITVVLAVPVCLVAARLFAAVFETPFRVTARQPDRV